VGPTCQPQRKSSPVHLPTPHEVRFSLSPAQFARPTLPSFLSSPQLHGTAPSHRHRPFVPPHPCSEPAPVPLLPISLLPVPAVWPRARPGAPMTCGLELGQCACGAPAWRLARLLAAWPLLWRTCPPRAPAARPWRSAQRDSLCPARTARHAPLARG
jgi:hypothetical protein